MEKLTIRASLNKLEKVLAFTEEKLEEKKCPMKMMMQVQVAVEEIFVNIARYAYDSEDETVTIRVKVGCTPLQAIITFIVHGIPYVPLKKEDPNIALSANERQIGGLGIFMVKKI